MDRTRGQRDGTCENAQQGQETLLCRVTNSGDLEEGENDNL